MVTQTLLTEQGCRRPADAASSSAEQVEWYLVRRKGGDRWTVFPAAQLEYFDDEYDLAGPYSPETATMLQPGGAS